ncbi:ferredoxin, 2Fe-2S [Nematocida sp. AWRm77]|nr:ferredoxin, 2Fe-2S [Nematocida sp. AWRm77]
MGLLKVVFSFKEKLFPVFVQKGLSLLEAAHANRVPLQGACEGSLACTTCHVILDKNTYNATKSSLTEKEEDLLDQAKGLTHTSRLGCQLKVCSAFTGTVVKIPVSRNIGEEVLKTVENRK